MKNNENFRSRNKTEGKGKFEGRNKAEGREKFEGKSRLGEKSRFEGRNKTEGRSTFEGRNKFEKRDKFNPNNRFEEKDISEDIIMGRNPIMEVLKSERDINKILVASGEKKGSIIEILRIARDKKIVVQETEMSKLDFISNNGNHQGIIAYVAPFPYVEVEDILEKARSKNEKAFVIIADGITDPHNLGALVRTAEALGAHGIIIPKRNSVPVTSTVAKVSAGAIEYLSVARVTNIARCIEDLKKEGLWIIGADMDGKTELSKADLNSPVALVVGGEDTGIGKLVKEKCDIVVSIPMKGKISSLNASVAGAIMMYEVARQRG